MTLLQMRAQCLNLAAARAREDDTAQDIVDDAELFFDFLACTERQAERPASSTDMN